MESLYLAWRYLLHHRFKTVLLVLSLTLLFFVPVGLRVLVQQTAVELQSRAATTPILVGAKGSSLDLVLSALYFEGKRPEPIPHAEVKRIQGSGLAMAIPLHLGFEAQHHPIVGTTLDYLAFRHLRILSGRRFVFLGECVLGASAARSLGLQPGSSLVSSPQNLFDLAGVYPLEMQVVGVLAPTGTPDDRAVFVDLKTAWVIEGLGHGHQDLSKDEAAAGVLKRKGSEITANASVRQYQRITDENRDSFHFHGDPETFPVTAVLAVPHSEKSQAILMGRYQAKDERNQIVIPKKVLDQLMGTVFTVQDYIVAAVVLVGLSTLFTAFLVFLLSWRLRRGEVETMVRIGASKGRIRALLLWELAFVLSLSLILASLLLYLSASQGGALLRHLLLT